jgi:hypothetical protein
LRLSNKLVGVVIATVRYDAETYRIELLAVFSLLSFLFMEQRKTNQERSRKYGGSSSFVDAGEPSKAPLQDEDGRELTETPEVARDYRADPTKQGISNRPVEDEHAFPESSEPNSELEAPDSVEATPKQLGGNRGGV